MSTADSSAMLRWIGDSSYDIPSIKMIREQHPLQFNLKPPTTYQVSESFVEGNYTSLIASFVLVRRLTGSIVSTFAPSTMIVMMSWVSFWLKVDAVPARVALSVTSLLTLCTQVDQYRSQLPPVNYIKAMDIWLFVCIVMVFSTLLVFALSYNISSRKCKDCKEPNEVTQDIASALPILRQKINTFIDEKWERQGKLFSFPRGGSPSSISKECKECLSNKIKGNRVDEISKFLFPGFFLIFACAYWLYYIQIYKNH